MPPDVAPEPEPEPESAFPQACWSRDRDAQRVEGLVPDQGASPEGASGLVQGGLPEVPASPQRERDQLPGSAAWAAGRGASTGRPAEWPGDPDELPQPWGQRVSQLHYCRIRPTFHASGVLRALQSLTMRT